MGKQGGLFGWETKSGSSFGQAKLVHKQVV